MELIVFFLEKKNRFINLLFEEESSLIDLKILPHRVLNPSKGVPFSVSFVSTMSDMASLLGIEINGLISTVRFVRGNKTHC